VAAGRGGEWLCLSLSTHPSGGAQEVDDAVFYSPARSLVWAEAENRMWTVMAVVLAQVLGKVALPAV